MVRGIETAIAKGEIGRRLFEQADAEILDMVIKDKLKRFVAVRHRGDDYIRREAAIKAKSESHVKRRMSS